ncbi:hypothetical protein GCM10027395_09300 [Giesbergeria sinuosa]
MLCIMLKRRGGLWSPSYFASSCAGAPIGIFKQSIQEQQTPHEDAYGVRTLPEASRALGEQKRRGGRSVVLQQL